MSSQITAKKLATAAMIVVGIWYLIPAYHAKWNIESYFGRQFSASTVQTIGGVLLLAGVYANSQIGYTLVRVKSLDFLSKKRTENFRAISNFCNLVNDMDNSIAAQNSAGMNGMDGDVAPAF